MFDSEFAFYGPVAFDLGAIWANYVIAAARAYALGEDDRAEWTLSLPGQTWRAFEDEFRRRWPERLDPRVWREPASNPICTAACGGTRTSMALTGRAGAWVMARTSTQSDGERHR